MHRKLWWLFACLWCAVAGVASAQAQEVSGQSRQLWQLLEYVAVDYGGAVENGVIASEGEYAEMLDFTATAQKQIAALPEHPQRAALAQQIAQLQQAVHDKAAADQVAELAHGAAASLVQAYPFPMAPAFVPNLTQGAQLYAQQCASCHGANGDGNGPAAAGLEPPPIAFTDSERADARSLAAL